FTLHKPQKPVYSRGRFAPSLEGVHTLKLLQTFAIASILVCSLLCTAGAQTWTPLNNKPPASVGVMMQLRDGRILVQEGQSEGGEYNNGSQDWTNEGAVGTISGSSITWVSNSPPSGWANIGDAESMILPDGTYMQADCCTDENALYNGPNSWTATGSVKQSSNDESGFTQLTNDLILTVDTKTDTPCGTSTGSELYDQTTGVWSCGPNTPVKLYNPNDEELGSAVLMYNNQVIQFGGNVVATALYNVASNTWTAGPTPSGGLDQADGPAALEPNGNVLAMLSPGLFNSG